MASRVTIEVGENSQIGVWIKGIEPYDAIRVLISTALSLLEGSAEIKFNEGPPLTEDEEREIIESLTQGVSPNRDN